MAGGEDWWRKVKSLLRTRRKGHSCDRLRGLAEEGQEPPENTKKGTQLWQVCSTSHIISFISALLS